jgi:DNA-binding transcriptional MerR regulator
MSSAAYLTIGALARTGDVHVQTLRYYEAEGLLTPSARTPGGQRRYTEADQRRLHFIRHAREFGFPVEQIRELLELSADRERSCAQIDEVARRHRQLVRRRIELLTELETELDRMIGECAGGRVCECRVLEVLGDHQQCLSGHGHDPDDPRASKSDGAEDT